MNTDYFRFMEKSLYKFYLKFVDCIACFCIFQFYFGSHLLLKGAYTQPGHYDVTIGAWKRPSKGHITLVLTNKHGQIFQDSFPIR